MDTPRWVMILDALGPTLWLLTVIVMTGTVTAMVMADDRRRRARRSWDRTAWMLDLTTRDDRAVRAVGSGLLRLQVRGAADPRERRMLGELASTNRDAFRPMRLADGREVPAMPSEVAAARLKLVTSGRLGKPVSSWVQILAAGAAEDGRREDH